MKNEKVYKVFYRQRDNKNGVVFGTTFTSDNAKEAERDFEMYDNADKEWTIVMVTRIR
jgi:hypothetical protein